VVVEVNIERLLMVEEALFAMNPPVKYERPVVVAATEARVPVFRLVIVEEAAFAMNPPGRYESPVVVAPVTFRYLIVDDAETMMPPAPFGSMLTLSDDVANFELPAPPPQAAEPTRPDVMFKHPSARVSTRRTEVEATPDTVSAVDEPFTMRRLLIDEEAAFTITPPVR
jgi:hypothetical protein